MNSINKIALYRELGDKIRMYREKAKLTQQQLADRASLKRSSIAIIETGRQNVLIHTLYNIAGALNIDINEFFPTAAHHQDSHNSMKYPSSVTIDEKKWIENMIGRKDDK